MLTKIRRQIEAQILRLNSQREAIDAQLRPLLEALRILGVPHRSTHRRRAPVAAKMTRAQRTAMLPNLLQRREGLTVAAAAEKLSLSSGNARLRLEKLVADGKASKHRKGRIVVYTDKK